MTVCLEARVGKELTEDTINWGNPESRSLWEEDKFSFLKKGFTQNQGYIMMQMDSDTPQFPQRMPKGQGSQQTVGREEFARSRKPGSEGLLPFIQF